jgi:beta-phosphoglucomutase-like phosphatase (HAD superfamily)
MEEAFSKYLSKHGFQKFRPKAVLFDMDGVLYDSMPHHAQAWQQAMAQYGITMTPADAYATEGARGIDTIRAMVLQQQGRDISLNEAQAMYDTKTRLFHEMGEARVFYGVKALMQKITDSGMLIGVVTGSGQRPLLQRLLTDFREYLTDDNIVTAYDVNRGKPNPDPYLMGMQKLGNLQPWQTIVVENAPLGIQAAVAAQCFTIAVNTGPLPDEQLLQEGADLLFPHMNLLNRMWESTIIEGIAGHKSFQTMWNNNYEKFLTFLRNRHRRPSKYKSEEWDLVNWLKYNKKLLAADKMPPQRKEKFLYLLELCQKYQRVNQHQYANKATATPTTTPTPEQVLDQDNEQKEKSSPTSSQLFFDFDD